MFLFVRLLLAAVLARDQLGEAGRLASRGHGRSRFAGSPILPIPSHRTPPRPHRGDGMVLDVRARRQRGGSTTMYVASARRVTYGVRTCLGRLSRTDALGQAFSMQSFV